VDDKHFVSIAVITKCSPSIQVLLPSRRIYQSVESHLFAQAPQWTHHSGYYPSATESVICPARFTGSR
jgi:hypothetical protein